MKEYQFRMFPTLPTHKPLAHICLSSSGAIRRESLREHLTETAKLAEAFARKFNLEYTASIVAKFHDLGKFSEEFQRYLTQSAGDTEETSEAPNARSRGPDHSTAGAKFTEESFPKNNIGRLLAYTIAGHHAGLPNGVDSGKSSLEYRLKYKNLCTWESNARENLPPEFFRLPDTNLFTQEILRVAKKSTDSRFSFSFLVRMIFSCLVDADFLATEKFMNPEKAEIRERSPENTIPNLDERLTNYLKRFDDPTSPIGVIRNEIRSDCIAAAELPPGTFRLTVPTGGGKTLSSLAFALKHARRYGLERIIYVIPFTSIIEQNAEVFRKAIGDESIVEHHCNVEIDDDSKNTQAKLASENWDAPVVVTTSVQFFESLFSHKASRSRKLHNLAKSVIILDEAQTLPVEFLRPCLRALDELVRNYGASIVLCTATQPAVDYSEKFEDGLRGNEHGIREIIAPKRNLHERLKRVSVKKISAPLSHDTLATKLSLERQVLAIVNTRKNARELFEELKSSVPEEDRCNVFHLSASMCPEHRRAILCTIREKLRKNEACRVVSTQLIEAGVDADFPCVYRALSGIDSIAQAAGRCNREGKIGGNGGRVYIFEPIAGTPPGFLRTSADCGKQVLALEEFGDDPLSENSVNKYFELMYWIRGNDLDKHNILDALSSDGNFFGFKFRDAGEAFKLIEEDTKTVIIPFGESGRSLCEELRETFNPSEQRILARKLQRYAVSVFKPIFEQAVSDGQIQILHERYAVLVSPELHYDSDFGLCFNREQEIPVL